MNMITVYILCFTLLAGRLVNCNLASHYLDHYPPYNASLPPGLNESDFQEHFLAPKLYQFMIGGLSKVIWESMPGMVNDSQLAISDTCRSSLVETLDALTTGRKWAFEILDSSSKKPYGIMDGTLAYFGDYDQCLDIVIKGQAGESTGKYCAVNLMPLDTSPVPYLDEHYLHLTSLPVQGVGFYFGQCFPSNCSQSDVETIISTALSHGYPLSFESLSCDTHEVNSYSYRFSHISESQKKAVIFLISVLSLVSLVTALDKFFPAHVSDNIIAKTFSIKQNLVKTFYISSSSKRSRALDGAKLALLMAAIVGHASFCLDVPQGLYLVGHHQSMLESTQSLITQPFINEARTGLIYLASGLTSFYVIDKALDNGFGSVSSIIASKYVKHVTALVAVIAHDLVWPLLFSGPLYNQAGQYVRDKCSRNFYDYLTLTHNHNGLDTCAAHTYVSAVDFQLFLVAIFVVYYLKVKVLGLIIAVALIGWANYHISGLIGSKISAPILITRNLHVSHILAYFDNVISSSTTYLPFYLAGIIVAYALSRGCRLPTSGILKKLWLSLIVALYLIGEFSPALINVYHVVPKDYYQLFALLSRNCYILSGVVAIFYYTSVNDNNVSQVRKAKKADQTENKDGVAKVDRLEFSFVKGLSNLSFSIYLISTLFIRTDFFISRAIFHNYPYAFVKRMIYSTYFLIFLSVYFHLFFVCPVDNLRKRLLSTTSLPDKRKRD